MWISQLQWKWSPQQMWHRWTTRRCCSCFPCTFWKTQIVGIEQGGNPWNVCLFVKHVKHNPSICCPQEYCFAHPARHFFWQYPLKQILALMHNNNVLKVGHGGHFIAYYAWRTAMLQTEPRTSIQKQFTFVPIQDTMSTHVCTFFPINTGSICTAMFSK